MSTSEPAPAVLAELGSDTGVLALTNDSAPDVATEGLDVGTCTGTVVSIGEPIPDEPIPRDEPGEADTGALALTRVPVDWVPPDEP